MFTAASTDQPGHQPSGPDPASAPAGSSAFDRLATATTERFAGQPAWAAVTEIFIGLGWLRAAASKVIDPGWWSGDYLAGFLTIHADETLGWYQPFVDYLVAPNLAMVALIVLVLQVAVAASLLLGRWRPMGLGVGIAMNLHFVAAGAVNPSAFYLLAQGALALWLVERWSRRRTEATLPAVAATGVAVAGFNLPFIRTLHPAEVIDDPAIMFITLGALTALACVLAVAGVTRADT